MKTEILLEAEYAHSPERVWRALTDPRELGQWLMQTEGFAARVGQKFVMRAKPQPGWRGFVECEVLACDAPRTLSYSWVGNAGQKPTVVSWTLEPSAFGTRLKLSHTGFEGLGGFILAKLMLGPGWKNMLKKRVPLVLRGQGDAAEAACHTS